jgi:hypothetical protein
MNFNEPEWLRLLFLLGDTQTWLDDMSREALSQLPVPGKKKFLRKTYYLSLPVLAHILERHYYKINRYPNAGKFTIPVVDILHYIREAFSLPVYPLPGCLNFQRVMDTGKNIGFDKNGLTVQVITILTDAAGRIITAFPGLHSDSNTMIDDPLTVEEDAVAYITAGPGNGYYNYKRGQVISASP